MDLQNPCRGAGPEWKAAGNGETLEGIIYLPNRNVTYNSTTNVTAKIAMVVNQIIFNSANWQIEPYDGSASSASSSS